MDYLPLKHISILQRQFVTISCPYFMAEFDIQFRISRITSVECWKLFSVSAYNAVSFFHIVTTPLYVTSFPHHVSLAIRFITYFLSHIHSRSDVLTMFQTNILTQSLALNQPTASRYNYRNANSTSARKIIVLSGYPEIVKKTVVFDLI